MIGVILAAQVVPLGIPTTVVPPASPVRPATVFLVDFGRTSGLVLTVGDDRMVAYVYGDWAYYALRKRGAFESIAALLWPTQGALGRKDITGPANADTVRRGIGAAVQQLHEFQVEQQAVERLHAKLDRLHREQLGTATQSNETTFVHHPESYTHWSNSNHMTANWLEDLGCDIRGPAFSAWWRVRSSR
ncbi:MAG TPA: hypothetical protein VMN81_06590 [Vicinamibacterales bacterium]|nr:hypothetical protein [Vicinamibacterales bacterium]